MKRAQVKAIFGALLALAAQCHGQTLLNIDFGAGSASAKTGLAATGMGTNDFWNLYRHYEPKFTPGMPLVSDGKLDKVKFSDGSASPVSVAVNNAPGVWGNSSGDPMYDTYIYSQNGSNLTVTVSGLAPGRYHIYLYGHADADVSGEQNPVFTLRAGTNTFGPVAQTGGSGWKATHASQEGAQYIVFRDVPVGGQPLVLDVAPGPNGVALINGMQIISRGTGPPRVITSTSTKSTPANTNLMFREIRYDGKVSDTEARFTAAFDVESLTTNEISAPLFEGDVALIAPELPEGLRIVSQGRQTRLFCAKPGVYSVKLELIARITKAEPWNQISFTGPPAAIASVNAIASGAGVEMQLLSGTQMSSDGASGASAPLRGFLGSDRVLAMRWQSKAAEISRKSLVTVDTRAGALITPTVIKYTTMLRYEILQAPLPRLTITLPANQALTRIQGEQIRDWQVKPDGDRQMLTVEFIKPAEKAYEITLFSEQTLDTTPLTARLAPPEPLEVARESGSFTISADDTTVKIESAPGLRQVNAPANALAAYRFNGRPISVAANLARIEPVLKLVDRATARLEDTRLLVSHNLMLSVEKAGIYGVELTPQAGLVVSEVKGEGIEDWKMTDGKVKISFSSRVLGARGIEVQLEQALKEFPEKISVTPLAVSGATNVTTQLGAASSPGIRLKTAELSGLREAPVSSLPNRTDELLAFTSEQPDWKLTLASEKLSARVLAEVFNLVTIGDGLVGGSATIRYGMINQGVQEFRVSVPAHWKNVEFTGANIRRKEQQTNVWTITLQDKAWGGYTLVLTYDYQFDPKGSTLDLAGAHALNVERETGSLGVMTAASLKLTPATAAEPLRRVDEAELSESDRALCTRPLLLAYKYAGASYQHSVQVKRFEEEKVLEAVADRIELTTVLTDEGQLLTQSSFMVKNNEKQFQKFKLPKGSEFWSSYVNGQPAKPERDGDWWLVPLPRDANRDQAFAVDIVFAQTNDIKTAWFPKRIELTAPLTDIPNTYAEWQLFAPVSQRLSSFGGNMTVAQGTTYDVRDAWHEFLQFYGTLIERNVSFIGFCIVTGLIVLFLVAAVRRGFKGVVGVFVVCSILAILAAMMLPALSKAKSRAQRISAMNNLKQIGLAARTWSLDNSDAMPPNFEAMKNELGTDKITIDPNTGQRFVYVGAGKSGDNPEAIIAYSPSDSNGRAVAFADGSVQLLNPEKFQEALQRDAAIPRGNLTVNAAAAAAQPPPAPANGPTVTFASPSRPPAATAPPPIDPATGLPIAAGRAVGGAAGAPGAPAKATATGVRPIRIDVPRTGQSFSFTKVLNAGQEPLAISVAMMRLKAYRALMMVVQVCAFALGLLLMWWLASQPERSSLWMAVAAALIIWSVASLLTMWRLLHIGLILALPMIVFAIAGWGIWRFWQWRKSRLMPAPAATALVFAALSFSAFSSLAQEGNPSINSNAVSIISATYTGVVSDKVMQFDASIQLVTTVSNQIVPLFGDDVAVESFNAPAGVRLVREGRNIAVLLPAPEKAALQFKLVARPGGDVTRRQIAFGIPPALASQVSIRINEPEADVDFPTAVSFERVSANQETRVKAVIGAAGRLEMNWTPRVKRAAEIAATVFAQNNALVTLGGGVINTRATLDYQISQGELKQVRLRIPNGQRLLRVEGDAIRVWEIKDDALVVELLKGISPAYRLTVETEKLLEKLPVTARIEIPQALDVKRETGLVALRGTEELSLTVEAARELQRVDTEEFHRAVPDKKDGILSTFRFLKPDFTLDVRADSVQARLEAIARNTVRIGAESVLLNAQIDYTIKRAGIFALRLSVPPGYRIESVSGANVSQWMERTEDGVRLVDVTLKERTIGNYSLAATLTLNYPEPPKILAIPGVHPLDTEKLTGFITVSTEQGVAAKTESFEGLTEIPFASVTGAGGTAAAAGGSALAYKFISQAPTAQPPWKVTVSTESVDPWVRAEIANTITLTETLVSGRTLVKYEIANAPVKEFRLRVPAAFRNVEISGAQIRRRDQTNGEWRVELQSKVRGEYWLTVTWEWPRVETNHVVELNGVEAPGVERETGYVALIARPPLQVTDQSATELLTKIDVNELPDWAGRADATTVRAYRYLRPGYTLKIEAKRFDEAEVLQALVDSVRLTTVVADDGQMMTEAVLSVRNNGRQHLEVELPAGATMWSAFVGGDPVRPSKREGKLLLPLARDVASDAPIAIEFTFVGADKFPKHRGKVAFASPKFDVPVKNARWEVYLPPDYDYSRFEGSMNRTSDATMPMVQVYSLSEYNVQQRAQEEQKKTELATELSEAKRNLKGANLRSAVSSYNRAKTRGGQQGGLTDEERDLKEVEKDLRRAQGSNLINAQNEFYSGNAVRFGEQMAQVQMPQGGGGQGGQQGGRTIFLNNDAEVAGQQWDKLAKAQQVAVAKVAPLRVNLPTRGTHYSFAQVLQTEIRKPMTVSLLAENTKTPGWTSRIGLLLLGFCGLWLLMGLVNRRQRA